MTTQRVKGMGTHRWGERGAALVIVLLFMVVALIMITSVLAVTGNEIQIAGLHRDSVRALELAHAGLQEGVQRIITPLRFYNSSSSNPCAIAFTPSLPPPLPAGESLEVRICERLTGSNVAIYEVQADATVGRAVRRLSQVVTVIVRNFPPDIVLTRDLLTYGAGSVPEGDIYSSSFLKLKNNPGTLPPGNVFAAWYVRPVNPDRPACYEPGTADCDVPDPDPNNWFPGRRRSVRQVDPEGINILANTCVSYPNCPTAGALPPPPATTWVVLDPAAPTCAVAATDPDGPGGTPASPITVTGVTAENPAQPPNPADPDPPNEPIELYGFDLDTDAGGLKNAKTNKTPCGFPFKYIPDTVEGKTRYFKTIIYEQWIENYFKFQAAPNPGLVKRDGDPCSDVCVQGSGIPGSEPDFANNPQFAAIPPFPSQAYFDSLKATGNPPRNAPPSILNNGAGINIGCPPGGAPAGTVCVAPAMPGDSQIVLLVGQGNSVGTDPWTCNTGGTPWRMEGSLAGYGILVICGDLDIRGTVDYRGTIFVLGKVSGNGEARVDGGLITRDGGSSIGGTLTIRTGTDTGNPAVSDQPTVLIGAMWER